VEQFEEIGGWGLDFWPQYLDEYIVRIYRQSIPYRLMSQGSFKFDKPSSPEPWHLLYKWLQKVGGRFDELHQQSLQGFADIDLCMLSLVINRSTLQSVNSNEMASRCIETNFRTCPA